MRTSAFIWILIFISACVELRNTQLPSYVNYDFHGSYRKYLVKEGYVKYLVVDTMPQPDTTWIDLWFANFGAKEYYRQKVKSGDLEFLKEDSVQYGDNEKGPVDTASVRRKDFPMEGAVLNETSLLASHAYAHKPRDMRYNHVVGGYCWTYIQMDSVKYDCDVMYYKGIPVRLFASPYSADHLAPFRKIEAVEIDTCAPFPVLFW